MSFKEICEEPGDVSIDLLNHALDSNIASFDLERIGTGQVGSVYRVRLKYASETSQQHSSPSIILKIASSSEDSRRSGLSLGLYEREVRFYKEIGPALLQSTSDSIPTCYHAAFESTTGAFTLLLSDAGESATIGDDIEGATVEQARVAMAELGRLHVPYLRKSADASTLRMKAQAAFERPSPLSGPLLAQLFAGFKMRYPDMLNSQQIAVCSQLVAAYDQYQLVAREKCVMGLIHGDYRLDNMLFDSSEVREGRVDTTTELGLTIVDWQTVTWGPLAGDICYFHGCALDVEDRRRCMEELLQTYCDAIGEQDGDPLMDLDTCKENVRYQSFFGVIMGIVSSMLAEQTDRGNLMFQKMLERSCQLVVDLNATELLHCGPSGPLVPSVEDEGRHEPEDGYHWNESWYFDFVDQAQGIAGWIRLGLLPNQGKTWYIAAITRDGSDTVVVSDFTAPEVGKDLGLHDKDIRASHDAQEPLRRFNISLEAVGSSHSSSVGCFDDKPPDRSARLALDLSYSTEGIPYQYRIATRYELPCTVSGSVSIDGSLYTLRDVVGQRDHSWGARDWWSMDWVWSAFHTSDGMRLHAVLLRLPGAPELGVGYVQAQGKVFELTTVMCEESFTSEGAVAEALLCCQTESGEQLKLQVQPRGHAGMNLVSDDGKVSRFERAWCTADLDDGRSAVGWIEFNTNT